MEGSVAGVRILPAVVQFHDAEPGVLHQMSLKVQNLSKFSKSVRFHAPDSKVMLCMNYLEICAFLSVVL